ncbi:polyprotein [Phytophthora cinnamomi]|uniref:polyprotein n=1 Tax=Phytophthora cinnamomi TaxID=4785 RepID=UPI003559782D|nr:polyprotein [Phytophthora cinnamomi]
MNDTSMNDASTLGGATGMSLEHASFPHLSLFEWEALHKLAAEFMARELADLRQRATTPTSTKNKTDIVKLDVSTYIGEGKGRLHLNRWFCEVDIAIEARQLSTELARTRFLLSKLAGKAK